MWIGPLWANPRSLDLTEAAVGLLAAGPRERARIQELSF
jgi:hypothetical protein